MVLFTNQSPELFHLIENNISIDPNHINLNLKSEMVTVGPNKKPCELSPLEAAILFKRFNLAKDLLAFCDPSDNDSLSFIIASGTGDLDMVQSLIKDNRVNPGAQHSEALIWAITNHHNDTATYLLSLDSIKPRAHYDRSIVQACSARNVLMTKLLVEIHNVNPESQGGLAMRMTLSKNYNHIAVTLYHSMQTQGLNPFKGLKQNQKNTLTKLIEARQEQSQLIDCLAGYLCHGLHHDGQGLKVPPEIICNIYRHVFNSTNPNTYTDESELTSDVLNSIDALSSKMNRLTIKS